MEGDVAYRHRDSSCLYLCKVLETFTVYVPTGLSHSLVRLTIFHPQMRLQKNEWSVGISRMTLHADSHN